MSKPNTKTTDPQPVEGAQTPQPTPAEPITPEVTPAPLGQAPAAPQEGKGGNAEAAKYRRQLRDTEAERDALSGTVEALQRQLVAGAMPPMSKLSPDALWNTGRRAGEFFGEDGQLDVDGLTAAVQETHETLGVHYGADAVPGAGGGHSGLSAKQQHVSWAEAIKRK